LNAREYFAAYALGFRVVFLDLELGFEVELVFFPKLPPHSEQYLANDHHSATDCRARAIQSFWSSETIRQRIRAAHEALARAIVP